MGGPGDAVLRTSRVRNTWHSEGWSGYRLWANRTDFAWMEGRPNSYATLLVQGDMPAAEWQRQNLPNLIRAALPECAKNLTDRQLMQRATVRVLVGPSEPTSENARWHTFFNPMRPRSAAAYDKLLSKDPGFYRINVQMDGRWAVLTYQPAHIEHIQRSPDAEYKPTRVPGEIAVMRDPKSEWPVDTVAFLARHHRKAVATLVDRQELARVVSDTSRKIQFSGRSL